MDHNELADKENFNPITKIYSNRFRRGVDRRPLQDITFKEEEESVQVSNKKQEKVKDMVKMDPLFAKLTDSPIKRKNVREL